MLALRIRCRKLRFDMIPLALTLRKESKSSLGSDGGPCCKSAQAFQASIYYKTMLSFAAQERQSRIIGVPPHYNVQIKNDSADNLLVSIN